MDLVGDISIYDTTIRTYAWREPSRSNNKIQLEGSFRNKGRCIKKR